MTCLSNLSRIQEKVLEMREQYQDSHLLGHDWELLRVMAFVTRRNFGMRARLRRTLYNLIQLRIGLPASTFDPKAYAAESANISSSSASHGRHASIRGHLSSPMAAASGANNALHALHLMRAMYPCVGVHVRHGDALHDARGHDGVDRSIEAHVACAKKLTKPLGVPTLFLATDNVSLFTSVPKTYPEFNWYGQKRPLKVFIQGVTNDAHHSAKSKAQDLANMLVSPSS
jgi:hypothetical protein